MPQLYALLTENEARLSSISRPFDPVTGRGSVGERAELCIAGFPIPRQWVPVAMMEDPVVERIQRAGGVEAFVCSLHAGEEQAEVLRESTIETLVRIRCRHDFAFWAALFVYIKNKGGGEDVLFHLTRPQRRFVERLETMRTAGKPIRIVLLKARQWGGSTTSQIYMAWLQLVHQTGLNSLIIAHQGAGSDEIKDMFDRLMSRYPACMLHDIGEAYKEDEKRMEAVGKSGSTHRVPQRGCKIKVGTAERPDSCRGGDYNLVHLSEVGLWKVTDGKRPEDIVRSACSGVLYKPYTMIVYESTANGTGNFFQREYDAAKRGVSQFVSMFISWFDIDLYSLPFASDEAREDFARSLIANKARQDVATDREESGAYLWRLWEKGATLEAIHWYVTERAKYNDHASMAAEYPSDDVEAFVHSGTRVFDIEQVELMRRACRPPRYVGDVVGDEETGAASLNHIRFVEGAQGLFQAWALPEKDTGDEMVTHRYLATVDIGGRSNKADFSVVSVIDRLNMIDGERPSIVAQWYGHIDMDLLAWKAAQIAEFYNRALLVIESNTYETHDRERQVDGDQSQYILSQIADTYPNLYARKPSEDDIRQGRPRKYGFHTNTTTKPAVISTLVRCVRERLYTERDVRCIDEMLTYERKQNGAYGAIIGKHDDLLMTRAIGLHICFKFDEMPMPAIVPRQQSVRARVAVSEATI